MMGREYWWIEDRVRVHALWPAAANNCAARSSVVVAAVLYLWKEQEGGQRMGRLARANRAAHV
jgi:hypothetical protein